MAQQTAQSVTATPGIPHSFLAKAAAAVVTQVTALSVMATPGPVHSFAAKTAAAAPTVLGQFNTRRLLRHLANSPTNY